MLVIIERFHQFLILVFLGLEFSPVTSEQLEKSTVIVQFDFKVTRLIL